MTTWNPSRRLLLTGAAALTATAALSACKAPVAARAQTILKVGNQKGTVKSLVTAARALEGAPYTVEWSEFPAAQHLLEGLSAGAVDVGLVGDAPYLFAFAGGSPLKVVSAIAYGDGRSTSIVIPQNSTIRSVADLKGKRVATGKISVGHYLLLRALETNGLTTKDVEIVFLAPSDAKAAFASGNVDAWATWAPFSTTAVLRDKARILIDGRGLMNAHAYQVATPAAIAGKAAELKDFITRLGTAYDWASAHPEDYAAALSRDTGLPVDIALAMVKDTRPHTVPVDDTIVAEAEETVRHLAAASGETVQNRPIADAFAASFRSPAKA